MRNWMLFIAAAMAVAFAAFAPATASATTLTGAEGALLGEGVSISAEAESGTEVVLKSSFIGEAKCSKSELGGKISNEGGSNKTVEVNLETLTLSSCNSTVTVIKKGTLEVHTEGTSPNNNGTLTWSGTEITYEILGLHCIFTTSSTDVGTIAGSANTKTNATLSIKSAPIPRTGGRSGAFCGSSAFWSASYKFTTPSTLNVDGGAVLQGEAETGSVGETFKVTWRNVGLSAATIDDETNSNGEVVETLGSGCGTIAVSGSCTSREFKCLKKGEATLTVRDTPSVTGSIVVKCDEIPLTGGPTTANVGETVTVTWKSHSESAMVIEDETIGNGTIVETLGTSCGTIAATSSCTSRKIKCLKAGESTVTAADTPSIEGQFTIKCD